MSKYHNIPTVVDGPRPAAAPAADRYGQLKLLVCGNEISGLELQPRYRITVGGMKICIYVGDFRYFDNRTGEFVTEDVKGVRTPVYKLKKKLMAACHGIDVVEI